MLSRNRRKLPCLLLCVGVLFLSAGAERGYSQDNSGEVKKLLRERRDLLSEAANQMIQAYLRLKTATLQMVIQAQRDSLKADLDWFEKPEERIQAVENHKVAAEKLLQAVEAKVIAVREPGSAALQAKAYVLEVQIELLKEKQKAKPGK